MEKKHNLRDQRIKLYEIKNWIANELCQEGDRSMCDALFLARQAIDCALLHLEEVEYLRGRIYNTEEGE